MSLEKNLYRLRTSHHMTQDAFAEVIGVTRQAVQKWENGSACPDMEHIVHIAKRFHVSIDALILDTDKREAEEMTYDRKIQPEYAALNAYDDYSSLLLSDLLQCTEEGKDLSRYQALFQATAQMPPCAEREKIGDILFEITLNAPIKEGYPYQEPSDLISIKNARPKSAEYPDLCCPPKEILKDKIYAAWLGRICGCLLGKPIEGMKHEELNRLLKESNNYPLSRYLENRSISEELRNSLQFRIRTASLADMIECAPSDDDTNYTVMAQLLLDLYGRDFTPYDVSRLWLERQPQSAYCTAERIAFHNFINGYKPPHSAEYKNPCREWIGAQIRADYFGYVNPANPEMAAEMAWRDASISHVKNGIYGEMFVAAMIAAAAAENDIEAIIRIGLSQIPEKSRLRQAIDEIINCYHSGATVKDCYRLIHQKFDDHSSHDWCHTISNAMIVTAALLWGGGDFGRSICLAVEFAFDTDCNGATVGSILGMRGGSACIGEEWTKPLNGQLDTTIFGVGRISIRNVAEHTMQHL